MLHNIVIYDDRTEWFGPIGTEIVSCSKDGNRVCLELEYDDDAVIEGAYILCDSGEECKEVYNRCCDSLLNHPKVIDLRGLNAKLIED